MNTNNITFDLNKKREIKFTVKDNKELIEVVIEKDAEDENAKSEYIEDHLTYGIRETKITVYPADESKNKHVAILIIPGGGFSKESLYYEGELVAKWLATEGITGIVYKYRLPKGRNMLPLSDLQLTMEFIRKHANELSIKDDTLGVWGFSCGGHTAASLATHFTTASKPDFEILFYPVISMEFAFTHLDTRKNLMGDIPTEDDIRFLSCDEQVKKDTPPTLLILSDDDSRVSPLNSIRYYMALKKKEISASMHIFSSGSHGWGFKTEFQYHDIMKEIVLKWLEQEIIE